MHARLLACALSLIVTAAPTNRATPALLGGADRFLTAVETDKPLYRIGDVVYVRGTMLHARTHVPIAANGLYGNLEVKGPKGEVVASGAVTPRDGVWAFTWTVPEGQAGGEYTARASYSSGEPPAERKFDVRAYRAPRLKTQIVFARDGYGPGDKVTATLDLKRAEGGIPTDAKVTATARVDEAQIAAVTCKVSAAGLCVVSFDLPKNIARGEGSLAFTIEDGGVVETAAKTIPILLQTLDLAMFAEGGTLVGSVKNRLYLEAKTPSKKPADLEGEIFDVASGVILAKVRTEHEGRGRVELEPKAGVGYALRITSPAGIKTTFPLPKVSATGLTFSSENLTAAGKPVKLSLRWGDARPVKVTLSSREVVVATAKVEGKGSADVTLEPGAADGVLIATVWGKDDVPLAERLVYRQPAQRLEISLEPDKASFVPGGKAAIKVKTTKGGKPVAAVVGLTVVDDSVLQILEKREQPPLLPVAVLLEPEVQELADAHVYLDEKNPKSAMALDLLLGTQGWRRFAFLDVPAFLTAQGDPARRVFAMKVPLPRPPMEEEAMDMVAALPRGGADLRPMAPPMPVPVAPPPVAAPAPVVMAEIVAKQEAARDEMPFAGARARMVAPRGPPMVAYMRVFAHPVRPNRKANDRVDFTETLYWNAALKTDAKGEARVEFAMSDAVTTFRAAAGGFTTDGTLGASTAELESKQPFYLEPKLPLEVTQGDVIRLPVAVVNGTNEPLNGTKLEASINTDVKISGTGTFDLKTGERYRRILELTVGSGTRTADLKLTGTAGGYSDTVTRPIAIAPRGFPADVSFGGMLNPNSRVAHEVTIPAQVVPGSVRTTASVFPTPLANMTEALKRMVQEPNGCFEQTSSTSYPMTMAQQYFTTHTGVDPKIVADAKEKLERSYQRLIGFETTQKGFEWFGEAPGHEALTAYGLLHFTDMAQVRQVDATMLENTRTWLLKQRDGKGGFERKRRALHTWVEDKDSSDAYITWALLEAGTKPEALQKEIANVVNAGKASSNSYVVALAANVAWLGNEKDAARGLMEKLVSKQQKTGPVGGSTQSIVGSTGEALEIETTSLATLAWLREPKFAGNVEQTIKHLASSCDGGRYGSTQSTVLALRAIVLYDKARSRPKAPGALKILVDGQQVGGAVKFDEKTQGALSLPDLSELLGKGKHRIELAMEGGGPMPYAVSVKWNAVTPDSSAASKVNLAVRLGLNEVKEGELIEATAKVTNKTAELIPTVVAIIGLPGGLEPRHDQLKELKKKGTIDAYEVIGREVVLYWRGMKPNQVVEVPLSLLAAIPGTYTGPASRAYLYYSDEHKQWAEGLKVNISPRG